MKVASRHPGRDASQPAASGLPPMAYTQRPNRRCGDPDDHGDGEGDQHRDAIPLGCPGRMPLAISAPATTTLPTPRVRRPNR
jgi:hypothetical protein